LSHEDWQKFYIILASNDINNLGIDLQETLNYTITERDFARVLKMDCGSGYKYLKIYLNQKWEFHFASRRMASPIIYEVKITDKHSGEVYDFSKSNENKHVLTNWLEYFINCCNNVGIILKQNYLNHNMINSTLKHGLLDLRKKNLSNLKVNQYNKFYNKEELIVPEKKFIIQDFIKFGIVHYDSYIDIINHIAYDKKLYVILPNLLRTLFENILNDIFSTSLKNKHKNLYFNEDRSRIADFSILIELLNQLSKIEYKNRIRSHINPKIIEILKKVKEKGNLSVHEVLRKITMSDVNVIQDEIDLALEALLTSYIKLKDADIEIELERLKIIEEKIGLRSRTNKRDSNKIKQNITDKKIKSNGIEDEQVAVQKKCINSLHALCSYLYGIEIAEHEKNDAIAISSLHLLKTYKNLILPLGITYLEESTEIKTGGMFGTEKGVKILIYLDCEKSLEINLDLFQFKIVKINKYHVDGRQIQDFQEISQLLECILKKIV